MPMTMTIDANGKQKLKGTKTEIKDLTRGRNVMRRYALLTNCPYATYGGDVASYLIVRLYGLEGEKVKPEDPSQLQPVPKPKDEKPPQLAVAKEDQQAEDEVEINLDGYAGMLSRFIKLYKEKRQLESRIKEINLELSNITDPLCEHMATHGVQRTTKDGMTVFRKMNRYVRRLEGVDMDTACEYLKGCGWEHLAREQYNANTLRSQVLECMDDEEMRLPEGFENYFELTEEPTLGVRSD